MIRPSRPEQQQLWPIPHHINRGNAPPSPYSPSFPYQILLMRIAVIGGAGRTAGHVLASLVRGGHSLVLLATDPSLLPDFGPSAKVKIVHGKPWDEPTLRDFLLKDCLAISRRSTDSWNGDSSLVRERGGHDSSRGNAVDAILVMVSHAEPHLPPNDIVEKVTRDVLNNVTDACGCVFGEASAAEVVTEDGVSDLLSGRSGSSGGRGIVKDGISDLFGRKGSDAEHDSDGGEERGGIPRAKKPTVAVVKAKDEDGLSSSMQDMNISSSSSSLAQSGLATSQTSAIPSRRRRKAGEPAVDPSTTFASRGAPASEDEGASSSAGSPPLSRGKRPPAISKINSNSPASSSNTSLLSSSRPGSPSLSGSSKFLSVPSAPHLSSSTLEPPRILFLLPPGTPGPAGIASSPESTAPSLLMRLFSGEDKVKSDSTRAMRMIAGHPSRSLGVFCRPAEKVIDSAPPMRGDQGRYVGFGSQGSQFGNSGPALRTRPVADKAGAGSKGTVVQVDRAGLAEVVVDMLEHEDEWSRWAGQWPLLMSEPMEK